MHNRNPYQLIQLCKSDIYLHHTTQLCEEDYRYWSITVLQQHTISGVRCVCWALPIQSTISLPFSLMCLTLNALTINLELLELEKVREKMIIHHSILSVDLRKFSNPGGLGKLCERRNMRCYIIWSLAWWEDWGEGMEYQHHFHLHNEESVDSSKLINRFVQRV